MEDLYLIQICNAHEIVEQKYVIGRDNADAIYDSIRTPKGMMVTMNKANVAFNGELVRGEYMKHRNQELWNLRQH